MVGASGTIEVVDSESLTAADLAQTFAQSMLIAGNIGSAGLIGGGEPLIIMPPAYLSMSNVSLHTSDKWRPTIGWTSSTDRRRFRLT